ncbi:Chaperone protein dnaK [Cyphellophora attinorum]|uniref:Chaperone protein dnaK n=1 Tax=Cyphellophora attinorum TaxID=1664694 RepID=A0A0N1H7U7_9EURO|nr:Chaperone protein dnaK [Phialophora attinorum]KPI42713.1 Chaperone protein dnaK [Phialophora attinorum]
MGGERDQLVVAVDYGTTTSVVAFGYAAQQDIITVVDEYPNVTSRLTCEVYPTEIVYDSNGTVRIGHQIQQDEPRFQFFKLDLNENRGYEASYVAKKYPNAMAKQPTAQDKSAQEMTTDYLRELHKITQAYISGKLGKAVLATTQVQYVLTVPAMWSDKGKELTRSCARAAGFGARIHLISEPEAAVTHALDAIRNSNLKTGDTFVCCDAGGGTGDLISYTIVSLGNSQPIQVKEAASGTGDLCGSSFVNNKFRQWFIERFHGEPGYDEDALEDAMQEFELLKRDFTGDGDKFVIRVFGLGNIPDKNIKKNRLSLTLAQMETFHSDVVSTLTTLVKSQIKATKSAVKAVLLVGGFGQSEYLKRQIQNVVGPGVEVIQPPKGQVAIARGALLQGFALTNSKPSRVMVGSRVARKAFGVDCMIPFDARLHNSADREWCEYGGYYRVSAVEWFVRKGDELRQERPVTYSFYRYGLQSHGKLKDAADHIQVYDDKGAESPSKYPIPVGTRKHLTIQSKLSSIPVRALRKTTGSDGKKYYHLDYEIRFTFFSAHTEYSLWSDDVCYGKAEAEYE